MKINRQKRVRKLLMFYNTHFGISAPYTVLVDGTICRAALKNKVNIADQLPKYLESEVKICTTSCCKQECKLAGALLYGPLKVLKQYKVVRCGHRHPVAATRCLYSLASRGSYTVGTQDEILSEKVRSAGGIPLLFISHNAINLEEPSKATQEKAQEAETKKLTPAESELKTLQELKKTLLGEETSVQKKRKKKGGPNPLSCKKKRKVEQEVPAKAKKKRNRRKKVHIPAHVKQHLFSTAPSNAPT